MAELAHANVTGEGAPPQIPNNPGPLDKGTVSDTARKIILLAENDPTLRMLAERDLLKQDDGFDSRFFYLERASANRLLADQPGVSFSNKAYLITMAEKLEKQAAYVEAHPSRRRKQFQQRTYIIGGVIVLATFIAGTLAYYYWWKPRQAAKAAMAAGALPAAPRR